jgi:hypothetical protein
MMTEEELKAIAERCERDDEKWGGVGLSYPDVFQMMGDRRHLLTEVERLREAQRWIPVSERMPKVGSDIWAYSDADGCCWTAYVADDEDYPIVDDLLHLPIQRVTYWMPQTKPPESQP